MDVLLPLVMALPVLLAVAWTDLRLLRIPDTLTIAVLAISVFTVSYAPPNDLLFRLGASAGIFIAGFLAFGAGMIGAGDVKFLSAFVLLLPTGDYLGFALLLSLGILASVAILSLLRRLPATWREGWRSLSGPPRLPLGVAIAFAGVVEIAALAATA